jgi:putative DNA primase/helicase
MSTPATPPPLPASLDAEKGVLCSVLLSPDCLGGLGDLTQKHFHHPAHGTIWQCFVEMRALGKPIDLVTVSQEMADRNQLEQIGGPKVLSELQGFIPTALNVSTYAETLKEKARARAVIKTCEEAIQSAYENQSQPVRDLVMAALSKLEPFATAERRPSSLFDCFSKGTVTFPELKSVGIPPRRKIIGDWFREADLTFIFAPRGLGKTWFSLGLATAITGKETFGPWPVHDHAPVLYVDGEMPCESLEGRMAGMGADELLLVMNHEGLFHTTGKVLNLTDPEAQDSITRLCLQRGIKVLILDNLSCLFAGIRENEADAWEAVLPWLLTLRRHRIGVVIVAHSGRDGKNMRGTSRREDAAFTVIRLDEVSDKGTERKHGARFISRFTKDRNSKVEQPSYEWSFQTGEDGKVKITYKEADGIAVLLQWVEDGLTGATDIASEMGISKGQVSKLAKKAIEAGRLRKNGQSYEVAA